MTKPSGGTSVNDRNGRLVQPDGFVICIGYKNILVNLDDAPKVERTYRSGDLHHERAQRATYSSETLENGSG